MSFVRLCLFLVISATIGCSDIMGTSGPAPEPLSKTQVSQLLSDHTVIIPIPAQTEIYPFKPAGKRYVYHQDDGEMYFRKEFDEKTIWAQGYEDEGIWEAREDEVCYGYGDKAWLKEPEDCYSVSREHQKFQKTAGDVLGLAPGRIDYRNSCPTGREKGCPYSWLPFLVGAYVGVGAAVDVVCSQADCPSSEGGAAQASPKPVAASRVTAAATKRSGITSIDVSGRSPNGKNPQYKIRCANGVTLRYWTQNHEWWGPAGVVGLGHLSIEQLAERRCG